MKKIITILFIFLTFVILPVGVKAQQESILGWSPVCLQVTKCGDDDDGKRSDNDHCFGGNHHSGDWSHRTRIHMSQATFPANAQLVVTECINVGVDVTGDGVNDPVCTTADTVLDRTIFCGNPNDTREACDHRGILGKKASYTIYPPDNTDYGIHYLNPANDTYETKRPFILQVGADGKSPHPEIEWQAWTPKNETRRYIAWYKMTVTPTPTAAATATPTPDTGGIDPSSLGGQQQATLTFPSTVPTTTDPIPTAGPPAENCPSVQYDPYGMVFDMKSLEPIPDARVQLREKNPQGVFDTAYANERNLLIGGANPFPTGNNGMFTFYVEDGEYSLHPTKDGYTHPALSTQASLHPNTKFVYSDYYFNDSPPIVQQGKIEHRDVPLMPANGKGNSYELKILEETRDPLPDGSVTYSGKVSHPFTKLTIEICSDTQGTESCADPKVYERTNGGPDKAGAFTVTLNQSALQPGQYFKRTFEKVDLTTLQLSTNWIEIIKRWFISLISPGSVYAQEEAKTSANLSPIVQYLEGYAYGIDGKLMPNAKVNIYIDLSELPVYQTTTDAKGYYRITSEYLPKMPYRLGYVAKGTSTIPAIITTAQFLAQNKEFIDAEKINPYKAVTLISNPRRTITPSFLPPQQTSVVPSIAAVQPKTGSPTMIPSTAMQQNNNMYLVGAILLLLVAAAATLIGVYMYKKKNGQHSQ